MEKMKIALAGNPNVGKSTLFNQLTGMKQHVGNWPGKTVEKKEGSFKYKGNEFDVIDLPGNYSLTAYSVEEIVSRDYIVDENPDVIVNIVDAGNLERNLYLTVQMMELGANLVLALNMNKFAYEKGFNIDTDKLSELLGIPVVKIEAVDKTGFNELMKTVLEVSKSPNNVSGRIEYGPEISEHVEQLEDIINKNISIINAPSSWTALKLLEEDKEVVKKIEESQNGPKVLSEVKKTQKHLNDVFGDDVDAAVTDARYGFIAGLIQESVEKPKIDKVTRSDLIDRVIINKYLGLPIFLLIMWLTFEITFTVGAPFQDLIDAGFSWLGGTISAHLGDGFISSLLVDGVIGGVGGVAVFIPMIFLLFLMLSILEDSGYMARAAFVMDKIMHKLVGLHGKSFIPMILGFGCCVPGIMATRTLENEKDRFLTMLIVPFMSCSARLPVYALFVAAFFSAYQGWVLFSIYLLGIVVAILVASLFKKTLFKGMSSPFVMELPPYRLPTVKGALIHMWERGYLFIRKMGTVILAFSILIWILSSLPVGVEYASQGSITGHLGTAIAPVFAPLGFGDWQSSVALIFGFFAKEVVVSTFGSLYSVGDDGGALSAALQGTFTPLTGYAFMVFVLLYIPCLATFTAIRRETNSWKWPLFSAGFSLVIAWVAAFIIYHSGLLLGFG
jgi:ferrous iron transport protein B